MNVKPHARLMSDTVQLRTGKFNDLRVVSDVSVFVNAELTRYGIWDIVF